MSYKARGGGRRGKGKGFEVLEVLEVLEVRERRRREKEASLVVVRGRRGGEAEAEAGRNRILVPVESRRDIFSPNCPIGYCGVLFNK
jgi:DUF4097 and DUF4098 domain-containing protein YvlB